MKFKMKNFLNRQNYNNFDKIFLNAKFTVFEIKGGYAGSAIKRVIIQLSQNSYPFFIPKYLEGYYISNHFDADLGYEDIFSLRKIPKKFGRDLMVFRDNRDKVDELYKKYNFR